MPEPESGPPPSPDPAPAPGGLVQIGSYRLIRPLGSGGMSSVFQGVHTETGHEVALKILPRSLARNATLLQRFLREAKSAESLQHPNIVAIYDRGVEAGRYYLVLEFIPGGDLHDRIRDRGPMPVSEAVPIVRGVCEALRHAAQLGLIHRDIKPANILLDADGRPRLADLGLALHIDDEDERVTRDGTTVGTVDYMAPEQARDSRGATVRSDIYSLGCTFYHLLSGKPPFIGGDVPEKLRKHAFDGPPDIRKVRPDVPEPLARLIQRMMAKKADQRPADYDALIAQLDALPTNNGDGESSGPLFALLDDDDNPADAAIPVPPGPTIAAAAPLYALIDDDDDSAPAPPPRPHESKPREAPLPRTRPPAPAPAPTPAPVPAGPADVSMAELAGLDDSDQPPRRPARPRRPATPAAGVGVAPLDALIDDDPAMPITAAPPRPRSALDDTTLRDLIVRGLLIGLAIVLVGVGIQQILALTGNQTEDVEAAGEADMIPSPNAVEPGILPPSPAVATADPAPPSPGTVAATVSPSPTTSTPPASAAASAASTSTVWVEPPDEEPAAPGPEPSLSGTIETQLMPDWARIDPAIAGPTVTVRRFDTMPSHADDLRGAFETPTGIAEIADAGPFFESDLAPGNKPRWVRAAGGVRPIVVLNPPTTAAARASSCLWSISGTNTMIEGIDLVVTAGALPLNVTALFEVRAGSLTLRDCSVTILGGAADRPFAVVRLDGEASGPATPHVRLERTLIRGPAATALELNGRGEAVVTRSVLASGSAPAVFVAKRADPAATVVFLRSAVLSTRSAVSLVGAGPAPGLHLRSAGSSLARVESGQAGAPLIAVRPSASPGSDGPARTLDWLGDNNVFRGWANWFEAGTAPERVVPHLVAARVLWPTSEARSRERPEPLAASVGGPLTTPSDVAAGLPELRATLAAVPEPSAYLVEKTIGSFELMPVAVSPPGAILPDLELTFNAADPDFAGDLGRFLASRVRPGPKQIRVVAQGQGAHASTPYRLPDGARLSIHVAPATPPLEWVPAGDGDAPLIEGHGSDLELIGAHLRNPGPGGPIDLIHLEDGRLTLLGCRLVQGRRDRDATAVRVVARTSRPLPPPTGLPTSAPGASLPWARISDSAVLATGTAIIAELARGAVRLNHCAVSGARTAIELRPQAVRRSAFLADLALERCTLAAGQDAIRLGPWTGSQRGPDRPWLVSGRECVVLVPADASGRRNDPGVALRGDLEGLPRGALLWQGGSNVYNVARLVALADQPPPNPGPRPDVTREWLDVWGSSHVQRVFGPGRAVPPPPGGTAPALAPAQGLPLPPRLTADALIRAGTLLGPEFGARPQPPPDVVVAASPVTAPAARPGANPAAPAATGPIGKPPSAATNRPF